MLEPYVDHPSIREKIVLVSSGYKAVEIEELSLNTVMWPTVFATTIPSPSTLARLERSAREKRKQGNSGKSGRGASKTTPHQYGTPTSGPESLPNLLKPWNGHPSMAGYSRSGALRLQDSTKMVEVTRAEPSLIVQNYQELD